MNNLDYPESYTLTHIVLWLVRRIARSLIPLALFTLLSGFLLWIFGTWDHSLFRKHLVVYHDKVEPPTYSEYHRRELQMPQHNLHLPHPEGQSGKYLWFANRIDNLGWGNAMQEFVFNSYLAYEAGWTHVFDNYTWDQYGGIYSKTRSGLIPSKIPYSVFLSGPLVGGSWPEGNEHRPRAVTKEFFDIVCPKPTILNPRDVDGHLPWEASAKQIFDTWMAALATIKDRCIEIKEDQLQIFSFRVFGDGSRLLDIWPQFKTSPVVTTLRWSPLIEEGFEHNSHLLTPTGHKIHAYPYETIPGLLALHLRRGDFNDHCKSLTDWKSPFNGFNDFPEFLDKFEPPSGSGGGYEHKPSTEEGYAGYFKHCLPTIEQIVEKVESVRRRTEGGSSGNRLKSIFIMTNGDKEWVFKLKEALNKAGKWEKITSTLDVELNWEQKFVSMAVDMLIGQRAQVIIGNGWSSLTSNVVMLRMVKGLPTDTNRFW
ncbi:hypothetical protein C8Q75DRAFT_718203 [Abortiporus biennis]|nr:hypothetical protein C8Q75DRAFT_718203 [Abortiporus biennis]